MKFNSDPFECHENILPLLENLALHAPVSFLLQQSVTPLYNPEDIITQYTIPDYLGENMLHFITNTLPPY